MTDAETLLLELLEVIPNGDKVAPLFAEDGALELPFHVEAAPTAHERQCAVDVGAHDQGLNAQAGRMT